MQKNKKLHNDLKRINMQPKDFKKSNHALPDNFTSTQTRGSQGVLSNEIQHKSDFGSNFGLVIETNIKDKNIKSITNFNIGPKSEIMEALELISNKKNFIIEKENSEVCRFLYNLYSNPESWENFKKLSNFDFCHNQYGDLELEVNKKKTIKYITICCCYYLSTTPEIYTRKKQKFEDKLKNILFNEAVSKIYSKLNLNYEWMNLTSNFKKANTYTVKKVKSQDINVQCMFSGKKIEKGSVFYVIKIEGCNDNYCFYDEQTIVIMKVLFFFLTPDAFINSQIISFTSDMNNTDLQNTLVEDIILDVYSRISLIKHCLFHTFKISKIKLLK